MNFILCLQRITGGFVHTSSIQHPRNGFIHNACFVRCHFIRLKNPLCFLFSKKSDCLAQFSTQNKIRKHTMKLILTSGTASSPQVLCIHGVGVIYEFFKCTTIPVVKSELDLCTNIFGASELLYTF